MGVRKAQKSKHTSNEQSNVSNPSTSQKDVDTDMSKNAMELDENECSTSKKEVSNNSSWDKSKIKSQTARQSASAIATGKDTKSGGMRFTYASQKSDNTASNQKYSN